MNYSEKLQSFFKSKGITQKELASRLDVSQNMMSRYMRGEADFSPSFIVRMVAAYPDLDLQYIFSEDEQGKLELETSNNNKGIDVIQELSLIQERLELIKGKIKIEI